MSYYDYQTIQYHYMTKVLPRCFVLEREEKIDINYFKKWYKNKNGEPLKWVSIME